MTDDSLMQFKVICNEEDSLCITGRVCQATLEWAEGEYSEDFYVRCANGEDGVAHWEASFPDDEQFTNYTDFDLTHF